MDSFTIIFKAFPNAEELEQDFMSDVVTVHFSDGRSFSVDTAEMKKTGGPITKMIEYVRNEGNRQLLQSEREKEGAR